VEVWLPGSFTKNFSWGPIGSGLRKLYDEIRLGFEGRQSDVPRQEFREKVQSTGLPLYIPLNFFLFNKQVNGADFVIVDELVFQALNFRHSSNFDRLALFAFNLSLTGVWRGASSAQRRPTLWANAYIRERVAAEFNWDASKVTADDIQQFVSNDPRYTAKTSRKLATNLNYLYRVGGLKECGKPTIERWWVNAIFLALDRIIEDRKIEGMKTSEAQYAPLLAQSGFLALTGRRSLEKQLAMKHLVKLYAACGSRERFSEERVQELTQVSLKEITDFIAHDPRLRVANDPRPGAAVHPTNPAVLKTIPRACALLAVDAGFDFLLPDELENFDVEAFVKSRAADALRKLKEQDIRPTMTAAEILKLTRER
jgi:hypothetical protein